MKVRDALKAMLDGQRIYHPMTGMDVQYWYDEEEQAFKASDNDIMTTEDFVDGNEIVPNVEERAEELLNKNSVHSWLVEDKTIFVRFAPGSYLQFCVLIKAELEKLGFKVVVL